MSRPVLVVGGRNQVARYLLPRLFAAGARVTVLSRGGRPPWIAPRPELDWRAGEGRLSGGTPAALVMLAPLALLAELRARLGPVDRYLVFSSSSVETKRRSPSPRERALVRDLEAGEAQARSLAAADGAPCLLLRPTLIYGAGLDRNLTRVARWIDRVGAFPLLGQGAGLRQPVHADDLAALAARLALAPRAPASGAFALPGASTLSYREMIERVFASLGRRPRLLAVPRRPLALALPALRRLPGLRDLELAMFERMDQDLVFDPAPARVRLAFAPRPFRPQASTWEPPAPAA